MIDVYTHDEKGKRQDIHRPSIINPGDYEYQRVSANRKDEIKGGPAGTCHHCGKAIVWEVVWRHKPSGNLVTFGEICTEILGMSDNRIDHEMVLLKRTVENQRKKLMMEQEWNERRETMTAQHPELVKFLDSFNETEENNYFVRSLKWGYDKYGSLLPRQINALQDVLKKRQEELERRLNEVEPTTPLPEGRLLLKGTILSHKYVTSYQRPIKDHKMVVRLEDGNKVYGSVPIDIERAVNETEDREYRGIELTFTATVKRSDRDEHFGWFSRPTKAVVL